MHCITSLPAWAASSLHPYHLHYRWLDILSKPHLTKEKCFLEFFIPLLCLLNEPFNGWSFPLWFLLGLFSLFPMPFLFSLAILFVFYTMYWSPHFIGNLCICHFGIYSHIPWIVWKCLQSFFVILLSDFYRCHYYGISDLWRRDVVLVYHVSVFALGSAYLELVHW